MDINTRVAEKAPGKRAGLRRRPTTRNTVRTEAGDAPVCTTTYNPYSDATNEAIAERIALCWNVCLGIPNEELRQRGA